MPWKQKQNRNIFSKTAVFSIVAFHGDFAICHAMTYIALTKCQKLKKYIITVKMF